MTATLLSGLALAAARIGRAAAARASRRIAAGLALVPGITAEAAGDGLVLTGRALRARRRGSRRRLAEPTLRWPGAGR